MTTQTDLNSSPAQRVQTANFSHSTRPYQGAERRRTGVADNATVARRSFGRKLRRASLIAALALRTALPTVAVVTSLFGLLAGVQPASAASVGECMVDRFDALIGSGSGGNPLNCTSNDVTLATYVRLSGPTLCTLGEMVPAGISGKFVTTASERYDIGVFISTTGSTPNAAGETCYNDYLHSASTTNTDINLTSGVGPYYNAEVGTDPGDTCGDTQQGQDAYLDMNSVTFVCQDSNNDGTADVQSCTVWANSASSGTVNNPSCTSELDTTAQTSAKCTCEAVEILGLSVQSGTPALTLVKTATPTTYSTVGAVINYSYLVTNSGNVALDGPFTVSDDKSTNESCPVIASLATGASITCTAS